MWIAASLVVVLLASLKRDPQHQAWEFAPNMYYPVGYEPLSQIDANPINSATGKGNLNMRVPVKGTIPQQSYTTTLGDTTVSALERMDLIARNVPADSIAMSEAVLSNPIRLPSSADPPSPRVLSASQMPSTYGDRQHTPCDCTTSGRAHRQDDGRIADSRLFGTVVCTAIHAYDR